MTLTASDTCSNCQTSLPTGALACPGCGLLVHHRELERLGQQAVAIEPQDPLAAAQIWQHILSLLPDPSPQANMVRQRIGALHAGFVPPHLATADASRRTAPRAPAPPQPLAKAIAWTVGSMLVSIAVYKFYMGWAFATGFVLLILVHEMGHVIANRYYGIRASAPIFLPYIGAIINLRQSPPNAKVEAIIGIGGPVLGSVGAFACLLWSHYAQNPGFSFLLLELAQMGFVLNLLNLLPVPPLDGGRVTAALSPWIWMPGVLAMFGLIAVDYYSTGQLSIIGLLMLIYALPRVWRTLTTQERNAPYYQISLTAKTSIAVTYLALIATLTWALVATQFRW